MVGKAGVHILARLLLLLVVVMVEVLVVQVEVADQEAVVFHQDQELLDKGFLVVFKTTVDPVVLEVEVQAARVGGTILIIKVLTPVLMAHWVAPEC
jgi:hypothetical protein